MLRIARAHSSGLRVRMRGLAKPLGIPLRLRIVPRMKSFLIRWLCTTVAVAVAVELTPMECQGLWALIFTALFLGVINAIIRPVLLLLSLPFIVVTLGFFILILNAAMLKLASGLVPGFSTGGFWSTFFGALIISIVNWFLSSFFRDNDGNFQVLMRREQLREVGGEKRVQGRVIE
jgi:putative membrane protein